MYILRGIDFECFEGFCWVILTLHHQCIFISEEYFEGSVSDFFTKVFKISIYYDYYYFTRILQRQNKLLLKFCIFFSCGLPQEVDALQEVGLKFLFFPLFSFVVPVFTFLPPATTVSRSGSVRTRDQGCCCKLFFFFWNSVLGDSEGLWVTRWL